MYMIGVVSPPKIMYHSLVEYSCALSLLQSTNGLSLVYPAVSRSQGREMILLAVLSQETK